MTDREIADLYGRWFKCITKRMKPMGKSKALKRFAVDNGLFWVSVIGQKYVEHRLYYKKELITEVRVV